MGVASHSMDGQTAVYILTLGVAPGGSSACPLLSRILFILQQYDGLHSLFPTGHRKRGIAMHLLQLAHQQANAMG